MMTPPACNRIASFAVLVILLAAVPATAWADAFDNHTAYWLRQGTKDATALDVMTMRDALRLRPISKRMSSPCIVVRTDEDNWAKAIVTWGFRKGKENRIPVVVIERFVTYRGDRENLTSAKGENVMLFPGFGFNFDIGQVVPVGIGQGEDVVSVEEGSLKPAAGSKLHGLDGPATPPRDDQKYPDPDEHAGVLPTDFAGQWKVHIDGRWAGRWELDVEDRRIFGRFISEDTQSVYEIAGKILALPHNAKLNIELANAAQSVDAFLWTKDKAAMAGTVVMADRRIGFYALRIRPE
ncbi:MAG: hypothetical protein ACYTGL_14495 [Planctomycetota bacterium]